MMNGLGGLHVRCVPLADHLAEIDEVRNAATRTIDPLTPLGAYIEQLERDRIAAEELAEDYRRRLAIAIDERSRAEKHIGELEGLLDALVAGIDAKVARKHSARKTPVIPRGVLMIE